MLTRLTVSNFKRFGQKVDIELGNPVVFIGPNDSGKTTALQALALWHIGLTRWNEKRSGKARPEKRPGVAINRRDLIAMPVPNARLLWRDLAVRAVQRTENGQRTRNIRMDILVQGVSQGKAGGVGWSSTMPMRNPFTAAHYARRKVKIRTVCLSPTKRAMSRLPFCRRCPVYRRVRHG